MILIRKYLVQKCWRQKRKIHYIQFVFNIYIPVHLTITIYPVLNCIHSYIYDICNERNICQNFHINCFIKWQEHLLSEICDCLLSICGSISFSETTTTFSGQSMIVSTFQKWNNFLISCVKAKWLIHHLGVIKLSY